jgi:hypothetical protein
MSSSSITLVLALALILSQVDAFFSLNLSLRRVQAIGLPHARKSSRSSTARHLWDIKRTTPGKGQNLAEVSTPPVVPVIEEMSTNSRKVPVTGPGVDERSHSTACEALFDDSIDDLSRICKYQRQQTLLCALNSPEIGSIEKLRRLEQAVSEDLITTELSAQPALRPSNLATGTLFDDWNLEIDN